MSGPIPIDVNFGSCCICEGTRMVRNIVMITQTAPQAGTGWGCAICRTGSNGAVAIVCDDCMDESNTDRKIVFVCDGYLQDRKRIAIQGYESQPFDHNAQRHPENANRN